jgi:hypothetical protein
LDEERGEQFDPELVPIFVKIVRGCLAKGDMTNFPAAVQVGLPDEAAVGAGAEV